MPLHSKQDSGIVTQRPDPEVAVVENKYEFVQGRYVHPKLGTGGWILNHIESFTFKDDWRIPSRC